MIATIYTRYIAPLLSTVWIMAVLVCVLDQLTKYVMLGWIDIAARAPIIVTSFFQLVMVWNTGISFGMLSHPDSHIAWFLSAVALGISAVVYGLALKSEKKFERLAYGAIIGGAIGNVIDRVRFGAVADFFSFHIGQWHYPAFNIADAAIFLGVAALLWMSLKK